MHDQYTLAMQTDAMRACVIQQHETVADTVEEVASEATDQRLKRQVRLKAATQRQRDVMLVWKLDCSGHCPVYCMST
jgi:hypothetical protein